jgi:hypothetical protein
MKFNLESFKKFYNAKDVGGNLIAKDKFIPNTERKLILSFGVEFTDEEKKLINEFDFDHEKTKIYKDKIAITTGKEIHMAFYNMNEEEFMFKTTKMDARTRKYLNAIKNNLGYLDTIGDWEEETFVNSRIVNGYMNTSDVTIGKLKDNRYCSEYSIQTAIDDYCIVKHYWRKEPSIKDVSIIDDISNLESDFHINRCEIDFNCWECGRKIHWLDIEGDFSKKYQFLKERYCGDC